jgi:acylphosphatase
MTEETLVRHVVVEGFVQGVGYRDFTRRAALRLGVSGWVRNRSDGAVEALIYGAPAAVEALVAKMRGGPRFAEVENLSVLAQDETPSNDDGVFVIRPTA